MRNVLALILGGGRGSRLFPLTQVRAKPAVPLAGKYRLIDIPISNCINSGINKIYVLTQFNSESLNRHVVRAYRFDIFSQGFVSILAAEQTPEEGNWFQGTADAVRRSLPHMSVSAPEYVLILSGDQLYRMDFGRLLEQHIRKKAAITIACLPVAESVAGRFGLLKINASQRITDFKEKPRGKELATMRLSSADPLFQGRPHLASMGIYVFSRQALEECLRDTPKLDFGKEIIPEAIATHRVFAFVHEGYWEDIGTIRAFYQANLSLTLDNPPFNLYEPTAPIYTHPRFLPDSMIRDCHIVSSLISEGCTLVGAEIRRSIVGLRSRIGPKSHIEKTLMMGADYYESRAAEAESRQKGIPPMGVGERSIIRNAILDKNVRLGRQVRIINERQVQHLDAPNYFIRDGIVIIPKNAIIPDGEVI
ncbi:MAG: glucose-1-phosphate adenylyltransferase [Acidobacteria bacterium]|nr:glucose-1-phosphate adenylyltransferase [Acidobacteriota bacterium]MBI3656153.1 glucose-1-phosphate adenylyltransferase [Acidobacteriota bacterium]